MIKYRPKRQCAVADQLRENEPLHKAKSKRSRSGRQPLVRKYLVGDPDLQVVTLDQGAGVEAVAAPNSYKEGDGLDSSNLSFANENKK